MATGKSLNKTFNEPEYGVSGSICRKHGVCKNMGSIGKLGVWVFAKTWTVLTKLRIPNFVSLNCIENQFSMLRKFVSRSKTFREENHLRVGPQRRASPCKTRVAPSARLLLLRVWKYGRGLVILPVMWHILIMFFCSFRLFEPHTGQRKPQLKFRRTQMGTQLAERQSTFNWSQTLCYSAFCKNRLDVYQWSNKRQKFITVLHQEVAWNHWSWIKDWCSLSFCCCGSGSVCCAGDWVKLTETISNRPLQEF